MQQNQSLAFIVQSLNDLAATIAAPSIRESYIAAANNAVADIRARMEAPAVVAAEAQSE